MSFFERAVLEKEFITPEPSPGAIADWLANRNKRRITSRKKEHQTGFCPWRGVSLLLLQRGMDWARLACG